MKKIILKGMVVMTFMTSFKGLTQCIEQISVNIGSTLVLDSSDHLWGGGQNQAGQLGDGITESSNILRKIGDETWRQVVVGWYTGFGIDSNGALWGWGRNKDGQVGNGSRENQLGPVQIGVDTDWQTVVIKADHTLGVKENGTLWGWGDIHLDKHNLVLSPLQIGTDTDWMSVYAGFGNSWVIKTNGSLWCWGSNFNGILGIGTDVKTSLKIDEMQQIGTDHDWKSISVSQESVNVLAVKTNGSLWGWGKGVTADGVDVESNIWAMQPVQIGTETNWKDVSCGYDHILALKTDGSLWALGNNLFGELGDGSFEGKKQFIKIESPVKWKAIGTGMFHSAAISEDNHLYTWGLNDRGQLVDGTLINKAEPSQAGEEVCRVLGVNDVNKDVVNVFPNPTNDEITIDLGNHIIGKVKLAVYNSLGQVILQKTIEKQNEKIAIEGSPGFYYLKIDFPDGRTIIQKVIKNK